MTRVHLRLSWLLGLSGALTAQGGETPPDEVGKRVASELGRSIADRNAELEDLFAKLQFAQIPLRATSALVVMPGIGDHIELTFDAGSRLQLQRRNKDGSTASCGASDVPLPGAFTARAFGPREILVVMETGNAVEEATVLALVRADAGADFSLLGQARIRRVRWPDADGATEHSEGPGRAKVVGWDRASLTAQLAFGWSGISRAALGAVVLADMRPRVVAEGGFVLRTVGMQEVVTVQAELVVPAGGGDIEVVEFADRTMAFVRQQTTVMRRAPVRSYVRERTGVWSRPAEDLPGVLVESEFTAWRDADGAVHLTTPLSILSGGVVRQTLQTFVQDPAQAATWRPAAQQFEWSGELLPFAPLQMVKEADGTPTIVVQQADGRVVRCRRDE